MTKSIICDVCHGQPPLACNMLVFRPLFGTTAMWRAVIIINTQKLLLHIYYAAKRIIYLSRRA